MTSSTCGSADGEEQNDPSGQLVHRVWFPRLYVPGLQACKAAGKLLND